MVTISDKAFEAATRRSAQRLKKTPVAVSARYDKHIERIVISLSSGLDLSFRPRDTQGLQDCRVEDLGEIEISPSGLGLHFPRADIDLYIPGLLDGFLGSKKWMAAQMGAAGGKATTPEKAAASRANGKLGGRPRKSGKAEREMRL